MNAELKKIFDLDQADHAEARVAGTREYDDLRTRDLERRKQVRSILEKDDEINSVDLYHAAWVLNHGDEAADAKLAYRLAERSLNAGYEPAKWLFAAAYDRFCMYSGKPQRFGTQIVPDGERYRLWEIDSEATDELRKRYNVPSIAEMEARAARESLTLAQPPMEFAPSWLLDAIARWKQESGE